jgi:hypothetical protein
MERLPAIPACFAFSLSGLLFETPDLVDGVGVANADAVDVVQRKRPLSMCDGCCLRLSFRTASLSLLLCDYSIADD